MSSGVFVYFGENCCSNTQLFENPTIKTQLNQCQYQSNSWWCHQMETFSTLLAICAGNSPVSSEFPTQRPVTRSFDIFFDLRLGEQLNKHSWDWWLETPLRPLWRQSNVRPNCGWSWHVHQGWWLPNHLLIFSISEHYQNTIHLCHISHWNLVGVAIAKLWRHLPDMSMFQEI